MFNGLNNCVAPRWILSTPWKKGFLEESVLRLPIMCSCSQSKQP